MQEAVDLGIYFTPMIFINGVQLRGWRGRPGLLTRTVNELAASNPPARGFDADTPPPALEKTVLDWEAETQRNHPVDAYDWTMGPDGAPAEVVVWGDYQEPNTALVDGKIRAAIADLSDKVRYSFRHYPFDKACNESPRLSKTFHANACLASRAVEAAGAVGGQEAWWDMHVWLMENQAALKTQSLAAAEASMISGARELGLDASAFAVALDSAEVLTAVQDDMKLMRNSVPMIFVNGKWIQRWKLDDKPVIETIIRRAAGVE